MKHSVVLAESARQDLFAIFKFYNELAMSNKKWEIQDVLRG